MLQKSPDFPQKTCSDCISSQTQIRNARDARDDQTQGGKTEGNGRGATVAATRRGTQWGPGLRLLLPRQDDEEDKTEWAMDGWWWMRIITSYSHPQLSFRTHLIFILVATVFATFYHSPKTEKAYFFFSIFQVTLFFLFFLFQLNFSSSVILFMHGFLSFLIKFLLWLTLLHAVVVGEVPVQVREGHPRTWAQGCSQTSGERTSTRTLHYAKKQLSFDFLLLFWFLPFFLVS
jgi:hypothetical protein